MSNCTDSACQPPRASRGVLTLPPERLLRPRGVLVLVWAGVLLVAPMLGTQAFVLIGCTAVGTVLRLRTGR